MPCRRCSAACVIGGDGAGGVARPGPRAGATSPGGPAASRSSPTCSPSRCSRGHDQQRRPHVGGDRGHHDRLRDADRRSTSPRRPSRPPGSTCCSGRWASPSPSPAPCSRTSTSCRLADPQEAVLNWTVLRAAAPALHPEVMRLAFVFILVGYGTKAGLAPMHTWLPDAHAEAPAPLSAMMSGVLLAVALYAIVRWKAVVSAAVGSAFPNRLLVVLGRPVARDRRLQSRDPAELQADAGLLEHRAHGPRVRGPGARAAGDRRGDAAPPQPHAGEGHDVPARRAACSAGTRRPTSRACPGCSGRCPRRAGCSWPARWPWSGLPPFGLFVSEFALLRAGFAAGRPWLMGIVLALLTVAFVGLVRHPNRMLLRAAARRRGRAARRTAWPLVPLGRVPGGAGRPGARRCRAPLASLLGQIAEIVGP